MLNCPVEVETTTCKLYIQKQNNPTEKAVKLNKIASGTRKVKTDLVVELWLSI